MMPLKSLGAIVLWTALFPVLVLASNFAFFIELQLAAPLVQNSPLIISISKYLITYVLLTYIILRISRRLDKKSVSQTIKWLGWPKDALDGIISFFSGTIVGIINVLLIISALLFTHILNPFSMSLGALTGITAVVLVGPPEELARCYIQKKLSGSVNRIYNRMIGNIMSVAFITIAFGLAHEVARLLSNLMISQPIYLFEPRDITWYLGGLVLSILYLVKKNWLANSVAHSWYNFIIAFLFL
jgi:hypothetical protein